jgi:hypothetical protein
VGRNWQRDRDTLHRAQLCRRVADAGTRTGHEGYIVPPPSPGGVSTRCDRLRL